MSQLNSVLNVIAISFIVITALFWVSSPKTPKPLPDDHRFLAQIQQPGTVLVKFGAEWCSPCRKIDEELDKLVKSETNVSVVKINIDENRELAAHYQVHGIPHLILFHNGKQVDEARGYRSRDQLQSWVGRAR